MLVRVLLLLEDPPLQRRIRRAFEGLDVMIEAAHARGARSLLETHDCDVLVAREGLIDPESLGSLSTGAGLPFLVLITDSRDVAHRSELLARGAIAVIGSDDAPEPIRARLAKVVARRAETLLLSLRAHGSARHGRLTDLVTNSAPMQEFARLIPKVAAQDSTVLLTGETGVGKERLAHVIHAEGPRAAGPFVAVNCAALPDALLESELFGHEAGAFTDARRDRRGKFELAHQGTIFLDEIGEMPLPLQAKLLRVLQEREVERLGSEAPIPIDVRVIAATNADLKELMSRRAFRSDLYYRLGVITLEIPPLRERREDIPVLVEEFLQRHAEHFGRGAMEITLRAMVALEAHAWPGNVRELVNVIERAVLLAEGSRIDLDDLPVELRPEASTPAPSAAEDPWGVILASSPESLLGESLLEARDHIVHSFERWYLQQVLEQTRGRVGEAARRAGVDPRSLYEKLKKYGIDKRGYKRSD